MRHQTAGRVLSTAVVGTGAVLLWLVGAAFDDARDDARRDAVVDGAYLSWMVARECDANRARCDQALKIANANEFGVWFREDGSAAPRDDVKW